ncbi:MAG: Holliday junction branch migration protein RuvA [Lachnospiraceae bacterium]
MISYIKGPLIAIEEDLIIVEAASMGYHIHVPLSVLESLPRIGAEVLIHTYLQVREDAMTLYGFLNRQDLKMFRQLLGVNGVGPKAALGILSTLRPDDLRMAIIAADAKAIARAPGIGAKTAQRVILDLKDRIKMEDILPGGGLAVAAETVKGAEAKTDGVGGEAIEALVALGYSMSESVKAVRQVEVTPAMTAEEVLKASLKFLAI